MSANIEIKARLRDLKGLEKRVQSLCGERADLLIQKDVFYKSGSFRTKLRNVNGKSELIIYKRANTSGPKHSRYLRIPMGFPTLVHAVLKTVLGIRGTVAKTRTLFFSENTRIHLDEVEGLGTFLEFEVVLSESDTPEQGVATANNLMTRLGIKEENLISGSYIDLIESRDRTTPPSPDHSA